MIEYSLPSKKVNAIHITTESIPRNSLFLSIVLRVRVPPDANIPYSSGTELSTEEALKLLENLGMERRVLAELAILGFNDRTLMGGHKSGAVMRLRGGLKDEHKGAGDM